MAAVAVGMLAGPAGASIPPIGHNPPSWTGPAKVCAEAFGLDLEPGEAATAGWPSVGRIPYTVQTTKGRVDLVELWTASAPSVGVKWKAREGGLISTLGEPSRMAVNNETVAAEYLFQPSGAGLPVVVIFYGDNWGAEGAGVMLDRIDFGRRPREACTPSQKH